MTDLVQGFENEAAVAPKAFGQCGGVFLDELGKDWHSGRLAKTVLLSGVIGGATEVALARSPVLVGAALTAWGVGSAAVGAYEIWGKAWNATTEAQRVKAGKAIGADWGRLGATLTESTVGMGIGGIAGAKLVDSVPALESFAYGVTRRPEFAARALVPEKAWFRMPGSVKLGDDIILPEGRINAFEAANRLYKPGKGVETARVIDLESGRATVTMPGTPTMSSLGMRDRPGRISLHTHLDDEPPRLYDTLGTTDVGIVRSPSHTYIYKGTATEFRAALKVANGDVGEALASQPPRFNLIDLDHGQQRAFFIDREWRQPRNNLFDALVSRRDGQWIERPTIELDYQAASKAASDLDPREPLDFFRDLTARPIVTAPSKFVGLRAVSQ